MVVCYNLPLELNHILHYWHIYNIILAYICHAYNKFYIIIILGKLERVLESSLPKQNELR